MLSPVIVRKYALRLLYAMFENGDSPESFDYASFWELAQESERERFAKARAKSVLHCMRTQPDAHRLVELRIAAALEGTRGDLTAASLREQLEGYLSRSAALGSALKALSYSLNDKRRDGVGQLDLCCADLCALAATLVEMGETLSTLFADRPDYRLLLEPVAVVLRRRKADLSCCASLRTPELLKDDAQYASLAESCEKLRALPHETEAYVRDLLRHRSRYDEKIAAALEHYTPERVDTVDRCILYLALYELLVHGLKVQIVVAEATALAHEYSGRMSAPFVHGIISAVANA